MVTLYDVQVLGFEFIEDYFDYIIDSRINGNHKQAKELFLKLSHLEVGMTETSQRQAFYQYANELFPFEATDEFDTFSQEFEDYIKKINP